MPVVALAVIAAATAVGTTVSITNANKQQKQIKNAAADAQARNDKALADAKLAQDTAASQAKAQIDQKRRATRAGSQTIFTNPLGTDTQAALAKKQVLGG